MATGKKELDLVFICDCTGSMASYLRAAQQSIRDIAEALATEHGSDISLRFGLVEYRDHPPEESTFVTRVNDFTPSVDVMKSHLEQMRAIGGGDTPEAVVDGMVAALNMSWHESAVKVCVLIADAPPHGLSTYGDGFASGCPCGKDPMAVAHDMAAKGIVVYTVGAEPSLSSSGALSLGFMRAVAQITSGLFCALGSSSLLAKVIIGSASEQMQLNEILNSLAEEVRQKKAELGDKFTKEDGTAFMKKRLEEMNVGATQVEVGDLYNGSLKPLEGAWLQYTSLIKIREALAPQVPVQPMPTGGACPPPPPPAMPGGGYSMAAAASPCCSTTSDSFSGFSFAPYTPASPSYAPAAPSSAFVAPSADAIRSQAATVSIQPVSMSQVNRMYSKGEAQGYWS